MLSDPVCSLTKLLQVAVKKEVQIFFSGKSPSLNNFLS
jgi:hypothetical protein